MRLITIENQKGETIAINANSVGHIEWWDGMHQCVAIYCNGKAVTTKFTSIEAAVDYIQRASSMSMGVS